MPSQAGCLPEKLLEAYAFNGRREPECAQLEEHLRICRVCGSRLIYIALGLVPAVFFKKPVQQQLSIPCEDYLSFLESQDVG
jgi:hypothetical protein